MNAKKMLISLIPWALFSVIVQRRGADAAAFAGLAAAAAPPGWSSRTKPPGVIDVAGVVTLLALAVAAFVGGHDLRVHISDYGCGASTSTDASMTTASTSVALRNGDWPGRNRPRARDAGCPEQRTGW